MRRTYWTWTLATIAVISAAFLTWVHALEHPHSMIGRTVVVAARVGAEARPVVIAGARACEFVANFLWRSITTPLSVLSPTTVVSANPSPSVPGDTERMPECDALPAEILAMIQTHPRVTVEGEADSEEACEEAAYVLEDVSRLDEDNAEPVRMPYVALDDEEDAEVGRDDCDEDVDDEAIRQQLDDYWTRLFLESQAENEKAVSDTAKAIEDEECDEQATEAEQAVDDGDDECVEECEEEQPWTMPGPSSCPYHRNCCPYTGKCIPCTPIPDSMPDPAPEEKPTADRDAQSESGGGGEEEQEEMIRVRRYQRMRQRLRQYAQPRPEDLPVHPEVDSMECRPSDLGRGSGEIKW